MSLRAALKSMLVVALALPIVECVLLGVQNLVLSMGDLAGAKILTCLASLCLALWAVSLVGLVIVLAVIHVVKEDDPETRELN